MILIVDEVGLLTLEVFTQYFHLKADSTPTRNRSIRTYKARTKEVPLKGRESSADK